jgi:branched-subunit amino acid ABC-type transport system permease component
VSPQYLFYFIAVVVAFVLGFAVAWSFAVDLIQRLRRRNSELQTMLHGSAPQYESGPTRAPWINGGAR